MDTMIKPITETTIMTEPAMIQVTPIAAQKMRSIMQEKNLTEHGLRVFIAGGGCGGFQYGMAFENTMEEGDFVFDSNGVRLYVDSASAMYLEGAQVDYVDSLMGGGFRIENPNAVSTCSCGQSFSTSGSAAGGGCGHH